MSDYVIISPRPGVRLTGPLVARLDHLGDHLQAPGSALDPACHVVDGSYLVELSTGNASSSAAEWSRRFSRSTHSRISFANQCVRVATPSVTSRTLWVRSVATATIVSTSIRAISFVTGEAEVDPLAPAWMMLTGTLGPDRSWDSAVHQVPARTVIDLSTGALTPTDPPSPVRLNTRRDWGAELERRIRVVVEEFDLKDDEWTLPLSGGVDSRGLALVLGDRLPAVTWATPGPVDPDSDLAVARRVADRLGLRHEVLPVAPSIHGADEVLRRFALASESRTDQLSGYVDGMALWTDLREAGVRGIVRGDEVFGWNRRPTDRATRLSVGLMGRGDVVVPTALQQRFRSSLDTFRPPTWAERGSETRAAYRDRIYRSFRCPAVLAPLTQVKSGYVDVASPFVADPVVELVQSMPDRFRTDKRLFRSMVEAGSGDIPFAGRSSLASAGSFLDEPAVMRSLCDAIVSMSPSVLALEIVGSVDDSGTPSPGAGRSESSLRRLAGALPSRLPQRVRRELAIMLSSRPVILDRSQLLLRSFLVGSGQEMVRHSAAMGREVAS